MDKRSLSERDICTKFITPALRQRGLGRDVADPRGGRASPRAASSCAASWSRRGKAKRADYILYYKPNIPLALIEAKDNTHSVGDGMQQGLDYAATLDIPFVFSSNGDGFVFHDRTGASAATETNLALDAFPSPADLWARYRAWKGLTPKPSRSSFRTISTTAAARPRATTRSTPSTPRSRPSPRAATASCSSWRPAPARPTPPSRSSGGCGRRAARNASCILADRNVLIDQTMVNDFRPFGAAMAKLSTNAKTIERDDGTDRRPDHWPSTRSAGSTPPYEIYLGLYQAITGPEERQKLFREFSPGFFDLIVIDECHRGSAAEDSAWREILEYFSAATQIGLTATPKETEVRLQHRTISASRFTPIR